MTLNDLEKELAETKAKFYEAVKEAHRLTDEAKRAGAIVNTLGGAVQALEKLIGKEKDTKKQEAQDVPN